MNKYLVIGYASEEAYAFMKTQTDEDRKETMTRWMAWQEMMQDKLIDFGSPLLNGTKVLKDGTTEKSQKGVAGHMMIQAESMKEAIELLKQSPLNDFNPGNGFEVYECMKMQ